MQHSYSLQFDPGTPYPLGVTIQNSWAFFSLFCQHADTIYLHLFNPDQTLFSKILMQQHTGKVWHIAIKELPLPLLYLYEVDGALLIDPYAKEIYSPVEWKKRPYFSFGIVNPPIPFDWEGDFPLKTPLNQLILYEMHVRAFTIYSDSPNKGTFLGIIDKIPYLKTLGINAIEILPIQEFDETDCSLKNPKTNESLCNFWGYSTLNFFAPMNRYASKEGLGIALYELKTAVKALHKAGIEVILDIVFNHTGEGDESGQTLSFKGLGLSTYYLFDADKKLRNDSGCGNTMNCNHPVVIEMILDCLRYWVTEVHIDGFRFDLTSIFFRGRHGEVLANPPLMEAISLDPVLAHTKLIAEPWDAAGLYQLGHMFPEMHRWSEWNAQYRDTIRRFIKGNPGTKAAFATCLCGSQDIFASRNPMSSLNFIIAHDGFSLMDLVSYNQKHNLANGENNRDGSSFNDSWNCGQEGATVDPGILSLRQKQMRNLHLALMVSQGIPMIHMGDEYGHTKMGNNNTWCQDNTLNWFMWDQIEKNAEFFRFYQLLIAFRKQNPLFHFTTFLTEKDIEWHGSQVGKPNWNNQDSLIAFLLKNANKKIYVAFNAHYSEKEVHLPKANWFWVVNTAQPSPHDFQETPVPVRQGIIKLAPYSAILLTTG